MEQPIGIIGAGITGLACAYVLSSNHKVTIVARDLPGDLNLNWASPWAGATFHPQITTSLIEQQMQIDSFAFYSALAKHEPHSGVALYPMTEYRDDAADEGKMWYKTLMPGYRVLSKKVLPAGVGFGVKYTSLTVNPLIFLPWLRKILEGKGVKFVRAEIESFEEARRLTSAKVVVNASGGGARELAGDEAVMPVRGQTMFVITDFEQLVMREGKEYTYVIPRASSGGVIMGGIKSDRLDSEVDVELKSDILRRVNRITGGVFENLRLDEADDIIGFRPGRKGGLRVESEGPVIHAYGVEGAGFIYSFGIAERVKLLVEGRKKGAKL